MFGNKDEGCCKCGGIDDLMYSGCSNRLLYKGHQRGYERYTRCGYYLTEGHKKHWKNCEEWKAEGNGIISYQND